MALGVAHVGGDILLAPGDGSSTSDSWTSTANSLIVAIGIGFNLVSPPTAGDMTDSKGNTYSMGQAVIDGASALAIGIWYTNNTTRGTTHTVIYNPVNSGATASVELGVIEITGQDLTAAVYDTATDALNNDGVSPFDITAAAAIVGNQIAIYGCSISSGSNAAWTQPGGYTNIINQPNATADSAFITSYKLNETGTPTVGASSGHTIGGAGGRQVFATFMEPFTGIVKAGSGVIGP